MSASPVRVLVLRAPGTNCDEETAFAFTHAGADEVVRWHLNRLLALPQVLEEFQIVCVPGGFSFGDDIAAGRVFAAKLKAVGDHLKNFRDRGGLILGICNGFQALLQTGLLLDPTPDYPHGPASLAFNERGRYENRWVHIKVTPGRCQFITQPAIWYLPIAHAEGNFVAADPGLIDTWKANHQIAAEYVDAEGNPGDFPINPNGSMGHVAGLCDQTGRVFALMPHPERHLFPYHHPQWTRRQTQPTHGDGFALFQNAVQAARQQVPAPSAP